MESLKNFYVKLTNQNYVRDGENVIGVTCTDKMLDELELIVASVQEELETLRAENAKLIAERDMLRLCADHNEDEVKKMMAERTEYLANKILDASDKKLLDRLLAEREQYENHDVYATLYEDAKALIDPHTKASGGELPTSVIQSFEYLFKFWIEHKAEREAMMKQEPAWYSHCVEISPPEKEDIYLVDYLVAGLHQKMHTVQAMIHFHPKHGWRRKITPCFVNDTPKDSKHAVSNMITFKPIFGANSSLPAQQIPEGLIEWLRNFEKMTYDTGYLWMAKDARKFLDLLSASQPKGDM